MLLKLKIHILAWLLHRANRQTKSAEFYKIKNMILRRYATFIGYDIQFIEGKKCFACDGTGNYVYDYDDFLEEECITVCNRCYKGWYKRPTWNILSRFKFGDYIFHQPFERAYKAPDISQPFIKGYIEHNPARYGALALQILFLLYRKGYHKTYLIRNYNECLFRWYRWKKRSTMRITQLINHYKIKLNQHPNPQQDDDLPF